MSFQLVSSLERTLLQLALIEYVRGKHDANYVAQCIACGIIK